MYVHVSSPSTLQTIEVIERLCREVLEAVSFPGRDLLMFALHEGLINAVEATRRRHGAETTEPISVDLMARPEEVELHITDRGGGMSAAGREKLTGGSNFADVLWEESGRGLLFIRQLMDEVRCETNETGTTLIMKKRGAEV